MLLLLRLPIHVGDFSSMIQRVSIGFRSQLVAADALVSDLFSPNTIYERRLTKLTANLMS
jgi:hypothetical protein